MVADALLSKANLDQDTARSQNTLTKQETMRERLEWQKYEKSDGSILDK